MSNFENPGNVDGPDVFVTKSGKVLTDADIQALADEAERGYDPDTIGPNQVRRGDEFADDEPVVRYFGPERLRKDYETQVPAPLGATCLLCEDLIDEGDVGSINTAGQVTHYECLMRMVVGTVGHQRGLCSCFGGTEEDPPGLTRREAAIAALQEWEGRRR